ncbi:beta-ketoacyl-[acyl-carrier-protein] synthase family protein [Actinomadura sp. DC4]|uniref:beta-ketoacyl-[acyl-carrier-protein] synthase family protein n=1 Tax=Actinomadura sp. DC4 TaxID=3055069 RepID=UPI0025B01E58|nr:beta-ketoacyl-[acyl-carrier-protein] synthase family protein [Actinomadura sp. DC4]MDN3358992.1 beta-ketoacyl-[acyl-carrier-protein] synthase family protein [Actinomadura sp. DC4]
MTDRRVVITGVGAITPIGRTVDEAFETLMAGRSGVGRTTRFDTSRCAVKTAAEITGFDPLSHGLSARDVRVLDRYQQYALAAADAAVTDARLDLPRNEIVSRHKSHRRFDRYGAAIGMAFSSTEVLAAQFARLAAKGTAGVSPRLFNMTLPNAGTSVLSVRFGLCGPLVTVSGASASGADSIIAAYDKIRHGRAEVMLAGGAESPITEIIVSGFVQNHTGARSGACRPFDRDRDGTVLGEGAAVMVLEERDHAVARKARIHGEMLGYGLRGDAFDMSDIPPHDAPGMTACLLEAFADAGVDARDVGYLNVHGTATKSNDPAEATAIRKVFGDHLDGLRVSGIKGSTGHMLGGSGAFEAVVALLASVRDQVPPTYGLVDVAPGCELGHVIGQGTRSPVPVAISTSVGMGGNNSAIVVRGS